MRVRTSPSLRSVILTFFFFSGVSSLAYEVIWTRQIALLLGNTTYVISTVLAAFMGGLAGGSALIGRWADRRTDHLRIYGLLEIAAALYCLALPWIISQMVPVFRAIYASTGGEGMLLGAARATVSLILLLVPSLMLGGTLPVLSRLVARAPGLYGEDIGVLYAANTLGAVAGAVGAGFFFIPNFGVAVTLVGAASVATAVGILAVVLNRREGVRSLQAEPEAAPEPTVGSGEAREAYIVGLVVFAVSGFAAMAYEVVWVRLLTLFIGPSTYAFTVVLAAFIGGLALGSMVFGRLSARFRNLWLALGLLQALTGVGMLVLMNLVGGVYDSLRDIIGLLQERMLLLYLAEIVFFFGVLLVPTVFSGGVFPLVCQTLRTPKQRMGGAVGGLYAGNSVGAVFGSLVAGFSMVPALGIEGALRLTIMINLLLGVALFLYVLFRQSAGQAPVTRRAGGMVFASAVAVALVLVLPGWASTMLVTPPYMVATRNEPSFEELKGWEILYHEEGVNATVVVIEGMGRRVLKIEGKPEASAWLPQLMDRRYPGGPAPRPSTDMPTQILVGQIPVFAARNRGDVLVIGLASGVTVGSVLQHPDVRTVVCAEIAPEVYGAARYFAHVNHDALTDPRLKVVFEDGRNHLLMNRNRYDVIISQPSNPWMPGAAKLFTEEAFEAARDALKKDGIMCTWLDTYSIQPTAMRSLVRAFANVFPYVTMFKLGHEDYCLVGTSDPLHVDEGAWVRRMGIPRVRRDLERAAVGEWIEMAKMCLGTSASLRQLVRNDKSNTDDNSLVEFLSPLALAEYMSFANRAWVSWSEVNVEELFSPATSREVVSEFEEHFRERAVWRR